MFVLFTLPIIVFVLAWFSLRGRGNTPTIQIIIEYLQVIAVLQNLSMNYPHETTNVIEVLSFVNLNIDLFSLSCYFHTNYWKKTSVILLGILIYMPFFILLFLLSKFSHFTPLQKYEKRIKSWFHRYLNVYLLIFSAM